jgi:Peptidase family M28
MRILAFLALVCVASGTAGAQSPPAVATDVDLVVARLVAAAQESRVADTVRTLAAFGTRQLYSDTSSPTRGIGAAREWIRQQFVAASSRLQVSFDTYQVAAQGGRLPRDVELRNVVAVLPGRSPRRIYVTGHYDSVARRTDGEGGATGFDWTRADNDAPGANDDGSGTTVVLEAARVLAGSGVQFDATLVFVAFAGEEQGLVGATLHASRAAQEGWRIDAVLNNDIVGGSRGGAGVSDAGQVRVFSEAPEDSPSRQIARYVRRQAARYQPGHTVALISRADRFGRGGDHMPFNQHGFAAVRLTEARENYARQHTVDDTAEGVDVAYLLRNVRVNIAALASLALAPPAPRVTGDDGDPRLTRGASGYDAQLAWTTSEGAVGYRVFWRDAWAPDWQHELTVGPVTDVTLPGVSIDNVVIGVAALGAGGCESLTAVYLMPERKLKEIQTVR